MTLAGAYRILAAADLEPDPEPRECSYCGSEVPGLRCPSCGAPIPHSRSLRVVEDEHEAIPDPSYWGGT